MKDFYSKDLTEIVDTFYNSNAQNYVTELTNDFDNKLKQSKLSLSNYNKINVNENTEEYNYINKSSVLPKEIEKRLYNQINLIKQMQKLDNNKLYSKEEAFFLIFGDDYISELLSN